MGSLVDSIKYLRKKLHNFYSLFWEIESEGKLPTQSEASVTLISTQEKGFKRKQYHRPIALININAKLLKNVNKLNPATFKKGYYLIEVIAQSLRLISEIHCWFNVWKTIEFVILTG